LARRYDVVVHRRRRRITFSPQANGILVRMQEGDVVEFRFNV
jgi:hypothetical protein